MPISTANATTIILLAHDTYFHGKKVPNMIAAFLPPDLRIFARICAVLLCDEARGGLGNAPIQEN